MSFTFKSASKSVCAAFAALALCITITAEAFATPPAHAPAHGYREKQGHKHYNKKAYKYFKHNYYDRGNYHIPLLGSLPMVHIDCTNAPIMGTILGGAAGGLIGNQFGKGDGKTAATIGGAILGGIFGNQIGIDYATYDHRCANQIFEYAKTGTQVGWQHPNNGYAYSIAPTRTYEEAGRYCREYQALAQIGRKVQETYGKACRQPDGNWQIIK